MSMKNVEMKEREINLVDLFAEILLHWRLILVIMLVGGVVFGALSYMRSCQTVAEQKEQFERILENPEEEWKAKQLMLENQLTEEQINNVTVALMYDQLYKERLLYQQQSALMQLDPLHVQQAEITFFIQADDMEKTYSIKKMYEDQLSSTALYNYVVQRCGMKEDVNELIMLNQHFYEPFQISNMVGVQIQEREESDTFKVYVWYKNADTCQAMADAVVEYIQQCQEKFLNTVGKHEVILLSKTQGEIVDMELSNYQKDYISDISTFRNNAVKIKNNFSAGEQQYYEFMLEGRQAENLGMPHIASPRVSARYVILGMIFCVIIYSFFIFLRYILNNSMRAMDSFQKLYDIPHLGTIVTVSQKHFLGMIDQQILKLRYYGQRRFTPESSVELAAVAIKIAIKKQGLDQIYMIGCNLQKYSQTFCEWTKENLWKDGITVKILNNVLYDAEAMEKLGNACAVVLVETAGSTLYEEIVQELQLLSRQNIQVLGGILVE